MSSPFQAVFWGSSLNGHGPANTANNNNNSGSHLASSSLVTRTWLNSNVTSRPAIIYTVAATRNSPQRLHICKCRANSAAEGAAESEGSEGRDVRAVVRRHRRMWRTRSHTADNYGLRQTTSVMSAFQPSARRWTSWKPPAEFRVRRQGGPTPPLPPPPWSPPLRLDTVELKGSPSHQSGGHRFKTRLTCCGVLDQDRPPSV